MYQGGSDDFIGFYDDVVVLDVVMGIDFEVEIVVIINDVLMCVKVEQVGNYIKLLMLVNDVLLCGLIFGEFVKGFGFY